MTTKAAYPTRITGFLPTRSERMPAGKAWAAYTTLNRTYRRIATTAVSPTAVTRSSRNATEKSAKENTLAVRMNSLRAPGTPPRVTRRRGWGAATRRGSRGRGGHGDARGAGGAAPRGGT